MPNLLGHLPSFVAEYREIKQIMQTEAPELETLEVQKNTALLNTYVESADEEAINRYEQIMGIIKNPSLSIEERRFAIIAKINEQIPYTIRALANSLDMLIGTGGYTIDLNSDAYSLKVTIELRLENNINVVSEMVKKTIPANLLWQVEIKYEQHRNLIKFTHRELAEYTHMQIRRGEFA